MPPPKAAVACAMPAVLFTLAKHLLLPACRRTRRDLKINTFFLSAWKGKIKEEEEEEEEGAGAGAGAGEEEDERTVLFVSFF